MDYAGRGSTIMSAVSVSTAKSLIQLHAPSTRAVELVRASVTFSSTTSTAQRVRLIRQTTAGTGTTGTVNSIDSSTVSSTSLTNCTAEGTDGAVMDEQYVNVLNGYLWLPVPEERIIIPPSGYLALKLPDAPGAATTMSALLVWGEIG